MLEKFDLDRCETREQIEEAIVRLAYPLSPRLGRWLSIPIELLRSGFRGVMPILQRRIEADRDAAIALRYYKAWGVEILHRYGDARTGFEVLVALYDATAYVIFIGSDDLLDWRRNLSQRFPGLRAYCANHNQVTIALGKALKSGATELCAAGHSLGGAIAQMAAVDWDSIGRCLTFQTAAVSPSYVQRSESCPIEAAHLRHTADFIFPVSKARTGGGLIAGEDIVVGERRRGYGRIASHLEMLTLLPRTSGIVS